MLELSLLTITVLVATAFGAGFISSIAGAGGLITLPALLWAGLPPLQALGTNKVQSAVGTLSSTWNFFRSGHLKLGEMSGALLLTGLGSVAGTLLVQQVSNDLLTRLIPILLIVIAVYFVFSPRVGDDDSIARLSPHRFTWFAAPVMGFYGGFFGPGTGSILPFLFVWLWGHNLRKATAQTKAMVLTINGVSAILFALNGHVLWGLAAMMALAQMIGAYLGSSLVIRRGASMVQPVIIVVTLVLSIKLLVFP